jgi:hypothetical protein
MRSLLLGAVLMAGLALSPARAEVIEQFQAEDWAGLAYADDASGAFHNCIVFSGYQNGVTLMMIRTVENDWTVAFAHDDWQLTPGGSYRLQYKVDRRRAVRVPAQSLSAGQLSVADDRLIDQIRRGRQLTVTFDGTEYVFELSNSGKALKAAQDCVERHRGTVRQAGASPESTPAPPADRPSAEPAQAVAAAEAAEPEAAPAEATAESGDASTLGTRQEFGHWVVTATDDGAGNFVNCSAFGVYDNYNEQLILSHTPEGKWEFGLHRADWSLATDGAYTLWYNVDRSIEEPGVMKRPVEAAEPNRIFFEVSGLETLIERAATGRELHLQLRGPGMEPEDLSYSLDQAGAALEATEACVAEHLAQAETAAADDVVVEPDAADDVVVEPQPASAALVPETGDSPIESIEVPGWEAAAWAEEASGAFAYCSIRAEYQNGTVLGFLRKADNGLVMTLRRSDWSLRPGGRSQTKYQVTWEAEPNALGVTGGALERTGEAEAVDASTMAIEIGGDGSFMERLRQPQRLNIETEGMSLVFNIDDLPPGLDAIDECRERHLAGARAEAAQRQPQPVGEASLPSIGEQQIESFDVPGWEAGAYADASGRFTHCSVRAEYRNGAVLAFARTADNSLLLALARSDWTLRPGEWSPIRYSYGKDVPINNEGEAQALNANLLAANMGRDALFVDQLKESPMLTVATQGRELSFDISDLAPGLEAIDACRERHLAPADAASGQATAPADETAGQEGARYVAGLMERSGYSGDLNMLSGADRPDGFENYDAVWEIGEIIGMLTIQPEAEGLTLTQVRSKIVADDAASCEGEFSTATLASRGGDSAQLVSACKTADSEFSVYYAIVPRKPGGFYIVMHIGLGDGAAARAISSKVYETALL